MNLLQSAILAAIQGLTEFLPVSSSGHMVLAKPFLHVETPGAVWEVALHVGTLLAVLVVFRREICGIISGFCRGLREAIRGKGWRATWAESAGFRMGWCIVLGTVPAAMAGLLLGDVIEGLFSKPILTAAMLFITGEILWLSRPHCLTRSTAEVRLSDSIAIGMAQMVALVPGISRSGTTITAGLVRDVGRSQAAAFSFLLSVPAILGAALLHAGKIKSLPHADLPALALGVGVAAVTGYIALRFLLRVVKAGRLHWFAYYCWAAGVIGVAVLWAMPPALR